MAAIAENAIGSDIHRPVAAAEREYQRDVRKLVDLLSKLNPSAKEFFPLAYAAAAADGGTGAGAGGGRKPNGRLSADAPIFVASSDYNSNDNQIVNGSNKDSSSDGSVNNQPNRGVLSLILSSCSIFVLFEFCDVDHVGIRFYRVLGFYILQNIDFFFFCFLGLYEQIKEHGIIWTEIVVICRVSNLGKKCLIINFLC